MDKQLEIYLKMIIILLTALVSDISEDNPGRRQAIDAVEELQERLS